MIKIVSWNIAKRKKPWYMLHDMRKGGESDVALLQEAGSPPKELVDEFPGAGGVHLDRDLFDRWCLVIPLSNKVKVEPFQQVRPISEVEECEIAVSGIGTIATAKITPLNPPGEPFIAISMYARWMKPHPLAKSSWKVGVADVSAHRILSDLSAFVGHRNPSKHRILAAGDLNIIYGATGYSLSLPERERSVWDRMHALGLEFLGPQWPFACRTADSQPDVPGNTKNVPTFASKINREKANRQLDYVFASKGFHRNVKVSALNSVEEWGPSDHCRIKIDVDCG